MSSRRVTRSQATAEVLDAGRAVGAAAVVFHSVVAEKQGLTAVEEKALDFVQRFGPLTAGELAQKSGLAPPSVTGLIDRLEKKGFVERFTDPVDKRKVRVRFVEAAFLAFAPLFEDFVAGLTALCGKYSVDELTAIASFMREVAEIQQKEAAKIGGSTG